MSHRILLVNLLITAVFYAASAESADYSGRSVASVIDELRADGQAFAYSTSIVTDDLVVTREPDASEPTELLREILAPHGLTLLEKAGVQLVVRMADEDLPTGRILLLLVDRESGAPIDDSVLTIEPKLIIGEELSAGVYQFFRVTPGRYRFTIEAAGFAAASRVINLVPGGSEVVRIALEEAPSEIETITISASRYDVSRELTSSRFTLDQRSIQAMPDVGQDPIRITQRLPGAAASGASARVHFRGGEESEIGVMLNGQWLFDPYHVRDYQSIFSAIDSRAVSGVEVYTGGFPARYGDRMSGLVLLESINAAEDRHSEIGISAYNTSFLTSGVAADRRWLFSARRGNLDLVIDPKFGEPSYYDVFGELELDLSPSSTLSFNALYANDRIRLILESDPNELEQVISRTENAQFWMQLRNRWSDSLSSNTVLSILSYENLRSGTTSDIEKIVSAVRDDRGIEQFSMRQEWTWNPSDTHLLQWGMQASFSDAQFDYAGEAEFFELQAAYKDQTETISRSLSAAPRGGNFALYVSDRLRLTPRTSVEWGLRWDDQTYTNLNSDAQISPRLNFLHALSQNTELRLTWGRYHQSQPIQRLQIEDGIGDYWQAQRSDHIIAGFRHLFGQSYAFRVEAFLKDMSRVTPRFENLYNPLGIIPELQPDRIRLDPDSAQAAGIELSLNRTGSSWSWWASYSFSKVTDRIAGRDVPRSWDQRHAFQGGLNWTSQRWAAAAAVNIHSGWPTTGLNLTSDGIDTDGQPGYIVTPGQRNAQQHAVFASLDVRLSRTFDVPRGSLLAFIEISNVLDRRNPCCTDWDVLDDEIGNLSLERGQDFLLPLLPAIGVVWEF